MQGILNVQCISLHEMIAIGMRWTKEVQLLGDFVPETPYQGLSLDSTLFPWLPAFGLHRCKNVAPPLFPVQVWRRASVRVSDKLKTHLHQIHVAVYKYPGRATCIRIQVDTCRRDDNFVADTGYRRRQTIQMDTSGYNLYPGYMYQV